VRAAGDLELSRLALAQLSSRMTLLGTVPRSEMPALFRWADVLVLPSVSDTFGMVILEAMAAGLVVIASENTAAPDILRHGEDGFVVPIRDPAAIATALELLASDHDLMREMGRAARERAGEFTVSRYGERLMTALGLDVRENRA
jgi:glycosyltransferase involved in cell wall biosynthesis